MWWKTGVYEKIVAPGDTYRHRISLFAKAQKPLSILEI
jgi:hypothetical protein